MKVSEILLATLLLAPLTLSQGMAQPLDTVRSIPYSEVVRMGKAGELKDILVRAQNSPFSQLIITAKDGSLLESTMPTLRLDDRIMDTGTIISADNGSPVDRVSGWVFKALWIMMMLASIFLVVFLVRQQGKNTLSRVEKPTKATKPGSTAVTFASVAGQEEAKRELMEIVEFLREPSRFAAMGARIPKGVLLEGEPGNGKTMLAKALAAESGVAFFHLDASGLVEMFAGLGPRRVRAAFKACRKAAPCILFVDELDSVGKKRGQGAMGAQNEYDSILNQFLTEMDGIKEEMGREVIVIGATNRADMLDPALTRPGRLDRRITISNPTLHEREGILIVHTAKVPLEQGLSLLDVARMLPGCSGAEVANLPNEAAINATRHNRKAVTMEDFIEARDRFLVGLARPSGIMSDRERLVSAVHEAGHAVVGLIDINADPIHKATIQPRGGSLGSVISVPERDLLLITKEKLMARIRLLMAGRAAEMMVFGDAVITSGAREDIRMATATALEMFGHLGMGERMGFMATTDENGLRSEAQLSLLEEEVQVFLSRSLKDVFHVLTEARDLHSRVVSRLLEEETISGDALRQMRDVPTT